MKRSFILVFLSLTFCLGVVGQARPSVERISTKSDRFDFRSGGTISITGAPSGSIEVVGTSANEVEITAEIHLQAHSEREIETLGSVTGFITDETATRISIITVGPHNKFGQKKSQKNVSKSLEGLPFTLNYTVRVPRYSDLEIDGGNGNLKISGVEGTIRANFLESNARVEIIGGATAVTVGKGSLDILFGVKGWRGRAANVQVASGDMNISLPTSISAEIDAVILRRGSIENTFPDLKPRDRKVPFTDKSVLAIAGTGGVSLKFAVGDGTLKIQKLSSKP